jgi:tripartite-type tricarboxylate transporter receptor subunit TctC
MALRAGLSMIGIALLAWAHGASAQNFPVKPIRIVVPFVAGSGADSNPRFYGPLLSKLWGQNVVVDNRPGASGVIAAMAVKTAAADGYTLFVGSNSPITVNPVVMKDLPYDPIKDFRPVIVFGLTPVAYVVGASSPHRSIKDLVVATKQSGRPISAGNYSAGYELMTAWLASAAGLAITPVSYKGAGPVITEVLGNQIDLGVVSGDSVVELVKDGRLRALAITSTSRFPVLPDVPTMEESGYPGFVGSVWSAIFVRSEVPAAIVNKLHQDFRAVMTSPEGRAYQAKLPSIQVYYTPDEMRTFVVNEYERFKKIAQMAGIKPK